nr:unnamed protein product [Digitaria exilis]
MGAAISPPLLHSLGVRIAAAT